MSVPQTPGEFLKEVFGTVAPGQVIIWRLDTKATLPFPAADLDAAATAAEAISKTADVYFGLGPQAKAPPKGRRGEAGQVCALGGLWIDIDIKGESHKEKQLPRTLEEVQKLLSELPCQPTALVHTGGGVHAYWLFDQIWHLEAPDERKRAQATAKAWQKIIRDAAIKRGWKLDTPTV